MKRFAFLLPIMAVVTIMALVACGGSGPTISDSVQPVPPFLFQNATLSEQKTALALWEEEATCVGLDPSKARLVPFTVLEAQPLYCGTVLAAGCTHATPPAIEVRREWFSPDKCLCGYTYRDCQSAAVELLHLALLLHGENWDYDNPAFGRCL